MNNAREGGVFLAEGEDICLRDNDIYDNGTGDPNPIAGVSILDGDNISLEGNRIRNNGLQQSGSIPSADGTGAGIFISLAGIAANQATQDQADAFGFSLRIEDNVVDHPNGMYMPTFSGGAMRPAYSLERGLANISPTEKTSTAVTTTQPVAPAR